MNDPTLSPPPAPPGGTTPPVLPWEDGSTGFLSGLTATVKLFVLSPQEAFKRMSATGLGRPLFYAVIMAWIELLVGFAYWFAFQAPFFAVGFPELRNELGGVAVGASVMVLIGIGTAVVMPVLMAFYIFLHTCILHLALLIVGEGKGGFETTFRLLCYAHTADLGSIVPLCGGIISFVWFVVLQIVGVAEAHRCPYGKAALAVLLPLLLCCACVAVALSLGVGTAILGSLSHHS